VIADAVFCVSYAVAAVKGFAEACYKNKKDITKSIIYYKDKEDKQRREELITSLIKIKLKQL
jgi:hypothetical protein